MGFIYLIQLCDAEGQKIYKLGMTKRPIEKRIKEYYGNPKRIYTKECPDPSNHERKLLDIFKLKFKLLDGREFFVGDENQMKNILEKYFNDNDPRFEFYDCFMTHLWDSLVESTTDYLRYSYFWKSVAKYTYEKYFPTCYEIYLCKDELYYAKCFDIFPSGPCVSDSSKIQNKKINPKCSHIIKTICCERFAMFNSSLCWIHRNEGEKVIKNDSKNDSK